MTRAALAAACALLALAAPARAAKPRTVAPPAPVAAAPLEARLAVAPRTLTDPELRLRRAALEERLGHAREVVEALEPLDFEHGPSFAEADRAAFLLGQAWLALGSRARFETLARQVAAWRRDTPYTRWIARQYRLSALASGDTLAPGGAAGADTGIPAPADTGTALGRDLYGAARLEEARAAMARGADPRPALAAVPAASRYAARARQIEGQLALESGDLDGGTRRLESLLAAEPDYAARRDVIEALAGAAMDRARWGEADSLWRVAERDWTRQREHLLDLRGAAHTDALWEAWSANPPLSEALIVDPAPLAGQAARLAAASSDLGAKPVAEPPALTAPSRVTGTFAPVPPPPLADWQAVAAAERRLAERRYDYEQNRWLTARELERLEALRRYLERGGTRTRAAAAELGTAAARLDSLRRVLDDVDARLRAARDEAGRRIVARTRALLDACDRDRAALAAMRRFHLEGPHRVIERRAPAGYPSTDSLVTAEDALAATIRAAAERFAVEMPELIARSYRQAWKPRLVDRVGREADDARVALAWARRLGGSIDSSLALATTSDSLRSLGQRGLVLARQADSLAASLTALRAWVAGRAVERAIASLEAEREGLDYGLAASAYALGARLDAPAAGNATADSAAALATDAGTDVRRARAIAASRDFLVRHPDSHARAEIRFRLADLLLVDAQQDFERRMAAYLKAQADGETGVALPVLEQDGALELYRAILAGDPDFNHRDAVLFNAGTLLAERADPEADRCFRDLVALHPQSVYVQEAQLRRGDLRFDARDFAACVPFYEHAAGGPDPGLTAIALYKLGWASFNENRFPAAADAFRRVLDLYDSGTKVAISTDLRPEAEAYLVHSLARAGGAPAFAAYFDSIGHRPYETRVLMTLGQQFRRFSMVPEAAATDRLVLERAPLTPEALTSAERLVETYHRWKDTAHERDAQLQLAPAFAPGGAWARAQRSDSLKDAGAAFARTAWLAAARQSHRAARTGGTTADWTAARELYERLLAAFPRDSEAAPLHLSAGEAGEHLGDRLGALGHYRAAESGTDSVASQAMWQQVAVLDAWYRASAAPAARGATAHGSDSLARAELTAADRLLERFPAHAQRADLTWRAGNLAFAHGWYERAASDLGHLVERDPGDARTPRAAILRADAWFRLGDYGKAGDAYGAALEVARRAGADSLVTRAAAALPTCDYLAAEAAVHADSTAHARHAALFEKVAVRWPNYEHADQALYRAALAYAAAGSPREQIRALEKLGHDYPKSEYARDARLETARAWKALGDREQAAGVYADFAARFPADSSARAAWLEAGDLYADAGVTARAEELRLAYIRRYPDDVPAAMEILEALARRDLAAVGPDRPLTALLPAPAPAPVPATRGGKAGKGTKAARPVAAPAAPSRLAEYLALAAKHPELASPGLMSEVRFRQAEEIAAASNAVELRLPLAASIAKRKELLDRALAAYRQCIDVGAPRWSHAATFRIGENLVGFGEALETSERPADLQGDDLKAYRRVLAERSQGFYDRGENVWATLLKQQPRDSVADEWVSRAQATFWKRLSNRFYYQSEVDYPLVAAAEPPKTRIEKTRPEKPRSGRRHTDDAGGNGGRASARREGSEP